MSQSFLNPRRVAAGKLNRLKRRGLSAEGRERLRQCALVKKPWVQSTGPRTPAGKAKAAANGKRKQKGEKSLREIQRSIADLTGLLESMAEGRKLVAESVKK